jgi:hypothetical protein
MYSPNKVNYLDNIIWAKRAFDDKVELILKERRQNYANNVYAIKKLINQIIHDFIQKNIIDDCIVLDIHPVNEMVTVVNVNKGDEVINYRKSRKTRERNEMEKYYFTYFENIMKSVHIDILKMNDLKEDEVTFIEPFIVSILKSIHFDTYYDYDRNKIMVILFINFVSSV